MSSTPCEYPCAPHYAEHSSSTVGAKLPTATRGIRTGHNPAVDDLFVTDITSRHSVSEGSPGYETMATFGTSPPLRPAPTAGTSA